VEGSGEGEGARGGIHVVEEGEDGEGDDGPQHELTKGGGRGGWGRGDDELREATQTAGGFDLNGDLNEGE
jgi:hypothetical protein